MIFKIPPMMNCNHALTTASYHFLCDVEDPAGALAEVECGQRVPTNGDPSPVSFLSAPLLRAGNALMYHARTASHFTDFLNELSDNLKKSMARRICGERVYWEYFGVKHLHPSAFKLLPVIRVGNFDQIQIDELDFKILRAFEGDLGSNITNIARQLGGKTSTINYRLENLRKMGIIKRAVYWINPVISGMNCFRLHLVFRSLTKSIETVTIVPTLDLVKVQHFPVQFDLNSTSKTTDE
jgi:hypothetical protein